MGIFLSTVHQVFADELQFLIDFHGLHGCSTRSASQRAGHDTDGAGGEAGAAAHLLVTTELEIVNKGWSVEECLESSNFVKVEKKLVNF